MTSPFLGDRPIIAEADRCGRISPGFAPEPTRPGTDPPRHRPAPASTVLQWPPAEDDPTPAIRCNAARWRSYAARPTGVSRSQVRGIRPTRPCRHRRTPRPQQRDLLRQHGIADVDAVPDQAELCSVDADQGGDGEPDRVDQQVVQVVPGMRTGYA